MTADHWTPKDARSRDKWRQRGGLATIQAQGGLSREELAEQFSLLAEAKTNGFNTVAEYLEAKLQTKQIGVENTQLYQLAKQFGQIVTKSKK